MSLKSSKFSATNTTIIAIGVCLLFISHYTFVFTFFALMPGAISTFLDRSQNRNISNTILAFNISGLSPYILDIWKSNAIDSYAETLLPDFNVWLTIYGITAIGYVIVWIIPKMTAQIFLSRSKSRIELISSEQKAILETWDNILDTKD